MAKADIIILGLQEIKIFGYFWFPKVAENIGGAGRIVLCEQVVAQIKQKGGEAWAIQTDVTDECQCLRQLLGHRLQHLCGLVAI